MHVINNAIWPKPTVVNGSSVSDQRLTVSNSVVSLSAFNRLTQLVVLDIQDADVMVTFDGSNPSSTNGHRLYAGTAYTWSAAMTASAKFIRQATADAAIHASEFQI